VIWAYDWRRVYGGGQASRENKRGAARYDLEEIGRGLEKAREAGLTNFWYTAETLASEHLDYEEFDGFYLHLDDEFASDRCKFVKDFLAPDRQLMS